MNKGEKELFDALLDLVCCPAFNSAAFERDTESHKAWTLARHALNNHIKRHIIT